MKALLSNKTPGLKE